MFFYENVNCFFKVMFVRRKHLHEYALTKFYTLQKCAQTKLWHVQKVAFVFLCTVQICDFCIWKIICAADLRILCTTHFCTFADLHFAHLHICRKLRTCKFLFRELCAFVNYVCECLRICENHFFVFCAEFADFVKIRQNVEKVEISGNVPKMSEKSSRVPEWYTSGSWANAFDNTGWQKSPEYALIRIAAGAPDLAKSGQIRPRTAPDGKSSRIWRRFRFCSTGWNPVRSCFFRTRAQISDPSTCSRGASSSATESDTFCKCAHTSQNTRWKPPSGLRTFCTLCTPCTTETDTRAQTVHTRNTDVHTCAHLATTLNTLAENTSSMCCSCWGRRRADASFCIENLIMSLYRFYCTDFKITLFFILHATRVTLNAKSNISGGIRMRRSHKDPAWGTLWDSTKCLRLCADVFPQTEKGRKKGAKKASPFLYIYSLQRAFFGRF